MIKHSKNATDFQENAKDFVINMLGNKRKLHKKNGCYYAHMLEKYYDFDTYEQAKESNIEHTDCQICFRKNKTNNLLRSLK